jgi:uncharacterized protein (UPF0335 family)
MIEQQTCPHCGAERERYDSGFVRYKCGTSMSRYIADGWECTLSSNCYLNQLAQQAAEIERLRQAVLDERDACSDIADELGTFGYDGHKIAKAIRARGE